jgi:hypothetical protein
MAENKDPSGGVITLLKRKITVAPITTLGLDRMRLMARVYKRMSNGEVGVDEFLKIDRLFSMLVSKEDDMWLEDQILEGNLTSQEVIDAMLSVLLVKPAAAKKAPTKRASRARKN